MPKKRMKDQIRKEKLAETTEVRLLYDRKSAARMLSISLRSLTYLLSHGDIRFRRIGAKTLIPHAELIRFIKSHHTEPIRRPSPPVSPVDPSVKLPVSPASPAPSACAAATDARNAQS